MKTQQGSLFDSHGAWYVRYREQGKKNPVAHRLATLSEYPKIGIGSKRSIWKT